MNYNTQLPHLIISEYGRNVQSMVEHCCTIEARDDRNRCARAIIQVMGQLNPHLRDIPDFTHKLWDHLFIISKFNLDVDSPYQKPSEATFDTKPKIVPYPKGKIKYRHYGKIIEEIIEKAKGYQEGEEKEVLKRVVATQLKKSYLLWNKDTVLDEVIFKHLAELSGGALKMDESQKLLDSSDLMKRGPLNISNTPVAKKHNKNKHHKNFKRK
ncbi:MAG TPA: DUF4290 domain-containing protein [Bacteroidia bacterium]